jgi:16S rRNA (guanine527-N7)-methyltransferase
MIDRVESLAQIIDVSRETVERLHNFEHLVRKWNPVINLVSKPSLNDIWFRHIIDSAQIFPHIPVKSSICLDIGSGGGFPGIVLAAISAEISPSQRFVLVESDKRKATFLREAARLLDLKLVVHAERIEALEPIDADVLSARALSPLSKLMLSAQRHLSSNGVCLFPKGESYPQEVIDAQTEFNFDCKVIPSLTDPKGAILKIHGIRNA